MSKERFPFGEFAAVGGQMAQAWEKLLESFWQGLLADPARLTELAGKLGDAARGTVAGLRTSVVPEAGRAKADVEALEKRLAVVEAQLRELHDGLASVITYLEALPGVAGVAKKEPRP
jgi:hypothetical protein